ncbi:MAG: helix-turn-helix domain-containing protein [Oscillospiraceae bacterium]|nr:helix-turn-helix domain-containing protein [Oscillospiraceae bacterium]
MTLGERIAAARNRAGLTQLQLAQELGLQLFQVADWERGAAEPSLEQMAALCRVLDVTSDYLLLGKEPESAKPICPRCGRVLEPGTHFCPDCGQDQLAAGGDTYCLVLNQPASHEEAAVMMQILRKGRFWPDFPFSEQGTQKDMYNALPQAPKVLFRGLSREQAVQLFKQFPDPSRLSIYSDPTGDTPVETLVKGPGLNAETGKLEYPSASSGGMTFGGTVGAVIVGVIAAVLILSFL